MTPDLVQEIIQWLVAYGLLMLITWPLRKKLQAQGWRPQALSCSVAGLTGLVWLGSHRTALTSNAVAEMVLGIGILCLLDVLVRRARSLPKLPKEDETLGSNQHRIPSDQNTNMLQSDAEESIPEEEISVAHQALFASRLGIDLSPAVESPQTQLMWSDYPGAFEQHLLRRHNNPLFPQSRRIITQTDIDAARERDITDCETLKQELILLLETWLPDRETLFQQNVLGLQSVPLRDIIETRNEIRDRFDTLIQRAMGVGGSAYTLTYNLKELRHVHIQFWTQMVNDPEARRHLQEIDEEYDQAISTFEVSFIAQMRRQDHPMPTDEIVSALLTEKPEIIVKVISDIIAEDPSVHESWQQAAIFILQAAIQEGAEFPNMHEILQALGVSSDSVYAEAVKWYHQAAEQGDANAQNTLGVMYERGTGIPQDSTEAAKWYRQAAEQGLAKAQFNLGLVYAEGTGVPQDSTEALKWYRKATAQGDPEGQYFLARMYFYGQGVPQDAAEAVKWNLRAAEQGHKAAQSSLGILYENGLGVPQDYIEAGKWYRRAAEQGFAPAQYDLGRMYSIGRGMPKDDALAGQWWRRAARQGYATAQFPFVLGLMYGVGRGVAQDQIQAYLWLHLAAASLPPGEDCDKAIRARDDVAQQMTSAQLAYAQELARQWQPRRERALVNLAMSSLHPLQEW